MSTTHQAAMDLVIYRNTANGVITVERMYGTLEEAKKTYPDWRAIELYTTAHASYTARPHTVPYADWVERRVQELLTTEVRFNIGASTEEAMASILQSNGQPFPTTEQAVGPRRDPPALPLEVFNEQPVDGNKAMDITRVLCGGDSKPWRELKREGN